MLCGVDRLSDSDLTPVRTRLRKSTVAVLTHAAALDRRGRHTLDVLEELGVYPRVIFAPEHGLLGTAQAQEPVESAPGAPDARWSAPVISLYGTTKESLAPHPEQLEGIELLVIDLVDVGSRYYTYVWTALLAARAAIAAGAHCLVLDRPNPISGDPALVEGGPQQPGFTSLVGLERIPIRHSMTLGEVLARCLESDGVPLGADAAATFVRTLGWERHATASAWGRPFVMPSPNMPTLETALVYPGGCLLEGTNLSEGRGTTVPFRAVGAPFLDGAALAEALNDAALPGLLAHETSFRPTFDKYRDQLCRGVMLHVTDSRSFRPVMTYLTLITAARALAPDHFAFSVDPYEFETTLPAFDLLTGSDAARLAILDGASPNDVVERVAPVSEAERERVREAEALLLRVGV